MFKALNDRICSNIETDIIIDYTIDYIIDDFIDVLATNILYRMKKKKKKSNLE